MIKERDRHSFIPSCKLFNEYLFPSLFHQGFGDGGTEPQNHRLGWGLQVFRFSRKEVGLNTDWKGKDGDHFGSGLNSDLRCQHQTRPVMGDLHLRPSIISRFSKVSDSVFSCAKLLGHQLSVSPECCWKTIQIPMSALVYPRRCFQISAALSRHQEASRSFSHLQGQEFDSQLLRKVRLLLGRNISVKEVRVRLFHLLAAEPEDNEAYSTEISIDKWYTFLNSFQSTNSHFISFSKALNNL